MTTLDSLITEILTDENSSNASCLLSQQMQPVLQVFNTKLYGYGNKLKMIAWDRK